MRRSVPFLLLACAAATITACDETLEGGLGCSVLCPERPATLQHDTLEAVALDTTMSGFPPTGTEGILVVAARGDTFDARPILRFDSLPTVFRRPNEVEDSTITDVDSAFLELHFAGIDTLTPPFALEAYDVDMADADDTTAVAHLALFTPARLLGSTTLDPATLNDSIRIRVPIDTAFLRGKIHLEDEERRMRVGLRVVATTATELRILSSNAGSSPRLVFRPSLDTAVADISQPVRSKFPAASAAVAADLADFQLLVSPVPAIPPGVLRLGGVPGRRGYMRFEIPAHIVDSSVIVRAQLLLTQRPNPTAAAALDSGAIQPYALSAGGSITDLRRAMFFLSASFDSVRMVPADTGVRNFEIIQVVRAWRGTDPARTPRAIALRSTTEGFSAWQVDFFSNEAPAGVRPRLVITYVPQEAPSVP